MHWPLIVRMLLILTAFVSLATTVAAAGSEPAPSCRPPAGFVDTPPPTPKADSALVAHVEDITINRSLDDLIRIGEQSALEDTIDRDSPLPSVTGTHTLTPGPFGEPGTRRLVCLSDGSTLVEQVLVKRREGPRRAFRYVVWNYSTSRARAIHYGVGHFVHTDLGDGRTHVKWTYGFQLRRTRFPGLLGPLGDWLFRRAFLRGDYARMMQGTLKRMRERAEASLPVS